MSYSHYEVAHRFANGIGERCNGDNVFFVGDSIYSYGYHFKIAQKYRGKLLFNEEGYSHSTAKHKSIVLNACRQYDIIYCAELELTPTQGNSLFSEANFKGWLHEIETIFQTKLVKARKPEKYLAQIYGILEKAQTFAKFFEADMPAELSSLLESTDYSERLSLLRAAAERKKEAARKEFEDKLEKWQNFELHTLNCPDYQQLRYNRPRHRIETTMAVYIPYEAAKDFYRRLKDKLLKVGDYLEGYRVSRLGDEVQIGCHRFKTRYLLDFGKRIYGE